MKATVKSLVASGLGAGGAAAPGRAPGALARGRQDQHRRVRQRVSLRLPLNVIRLMLRLSSDVAAALKFGSGPVAVRCTHFDRLWTLPAAGTPHPRASLLSALKRKARSFCKEELGVGSGIQVLCCTELYCTVLYYAYCVVACCAVVYRSYRSTQCGLSALLPACAGEGGESGGRQQEASSPSGVAHPPGLCDRGGLCDCRVSMGLLAAAFSLRERGSHLLSP